MGSAVLSSIVLIFVIISTCLVCTYIIDYIRRSIRLRRLVKKGYLTKDISVKELADMERVLLARDIEFYLASAKINLLAIDRLISGLY